MNSTDSDCNTGKPKPLFSGDVPRPRTAPRFVSRRTGAALLDLSSSGFGQWVKRGLLPPPASGTGRDEPRWEWAEIVAWSVAPLSSRG